MKKIYFIICLFILTSNFSFSQTNGGCEGYAEVLGVNNGIFNFPPQYLCTHLPVAIHRHLGCSGAYDIGGSDPGVVYFTWNQVNNEYITYYFATPGTHVFDFTYTPNSCCPVPPPVHEMYTVNVPPITTQIYYPDADDDGFPGSLQGSAFCYDPPGYALLTQFGLDCDDNNPAIAFAKVYYSDLDNDTYGDPLDSTSVCSLIPPSGYVINNTDAFPNDPLEHIDSDGDGIGDNSDAFPNDPSETTDNDNDGYGSNSDCEDNNGYINPGATEIPGNGIDENCDPSDDGDNIITWTGSVSNEWKVADNWVPQQIPTATDDVLIPANTPVFPVSLATNACHDLTIEAEAYLTMSGGVLSVYGNITAPSSSCFNLTGGNLKLYNGSVFPPDMVFNNLTISMHPDSYDPFFNTYVLPGFPEVMGYLKILEGNSLLPKVNLPDVSFNSFLHVHGSITINGGALILNDNDLILDGGLAVSNGGLIGMESDPPIGANAGDFPRITMLGTATPKISVKNSPTCSTCGKINANLEIGSNIKISNTTLWVYDLILDQTYDLKNVTLKMQGKILYNSPTASFINTGTNPGSLEILQEYIPSDLQPLHIRANRLKYLILTNSASFSEVIFDNDLIAENVFADEMVDLYFNDHTLTIGSTTSNVGNLLNFNPINLADGNLKLLGNASQPPYNLNFEQINNLTVNSPGGVNNPGGVKLVFNTEDQVINGTLTLTSGRLDLNGEVIKINELSGLVKETAGHVIYSSVAPPGDVYFQNNFTAPVNDLNIGGLGFILTTTNPLNDFRIDRFYFQNTGMNGHTSIYRTYNVQNDAGGTGLTAKIKMKYDDTELDGINEADLRIFRKKSTESTWNLVYINSTTVNTTNNTVTVNGSFPRVDISNINNPNDFTIYTLGDKNNALRNGITINGKTEQVALEENQLLVFPNPATDHLEIRMNATAKQSRLEVISITGKQLISKTIYADEENNYRESLDINNLSDGIYILRLVNESGTQVEKFVKQ